MIQKTLIPVLKNIGLADKEARVYLACLELGSSVVAHIAKHAALNRVTAYDVLEKLMAKGFVSSVTKNEVMMFSATDPEIVITETMRKMHDFKSALPELKRLRGDTPHPRVQYFEGIEGIKAIYADTLTSKTEILNYASSEAIRKIWPNYDDEYVKLRVKKKIFLRGVTPDDEWGKRVQGEDQKSFREIRLVPSETFNFTNEINIYDAKVAIASLQNELIGMIIESKEIADTQRAIFAMAWEYAALCPGNYVPVHRPLQPETKVVPKIAAR